MPAIANPFPPILSFFISEKATTPITKEVIDIKIKKKLKNAENSPIQKRLE